MAAVGKARKGETLVTPWQAGSGWGTGQASTWQAAKSRGASEASASREGCGVTLAIVWRLGVVCRSGSCRYWLGMLVRAPSRRGNGPYKFQTIPISKLGTGRYWLTLEM